MLEVVNISLLSSVRNIRSCVKGTRWGKWIIHCTYKMTKTKTVGTSLTHVASETMKEFINDKHRTAAGVYLLLNTTQSTTEDGESLYTCARDRASNALS